MTDDLVAFLRARLNEDEQAGRELDGSQWWADMNATVPVSLVTAEWAIRQSPSERVLREVEAKRRLLTVTLDHLKWADSASSGEWGVDQEAADDFLRLLALPYADHPDYRPEWGV